MRKENPYVKAVIREGKNTVMANIYIGGELKDLLLEIASQMRTINKTIAENFPTFINAKILCWTSYGPYQVKFHHSSLIDIYDIDKKKVERHEWIPVCRIWTYTNKDSVEMLKRYLKAYGIPEENIHVEGEGSSGKD